VYCDFKPENVIQAEEQLKLIDLGGVRGIGDGDGTIYQTVGIQAPEIAADGPSPASDLYTVGRTLALLTFDFTGYRTTYKHRLPEPAEVPLLAGQDPFYRLLRPATDADPTRRFTTAGEMAGQLTGVLREVLAVSDGTPRPGFSVLFSPELQAIGTREAEDLDASRRHRLTAEIFQAALACISAGQPVGTGPVLGCRPTERALRFGLERSYRSLARLEPDAMRRGNLVDLANKFRPRTWSLWRRCRRGPPHALPAVSRSQEAITSVSPAGPNWRQRRSVGAGPRSPVPAGPARPDESARTAAASHADNTHRSPLIIRSWISGCSPASPTAVCGITGTKMR